MSKLRAMYEDVYSNRPPLFTVSEIKTGILRSNEYYLPVRDYYWLRNWGPKDSPETPLFWSHFQLPNPIVEYLGIDGTERACGSNDFGKLLQPLTGRWEKATLNLKSQDH